MKRTAAILAGLAVSACAGLPQTSTGGLTPFYDRSVVAYAAQGGAIPLVVHGSPHPDVDPAEAATLIAQDLRLPGWFPPTPFRPAPVPGAPSGDYRLVLIFNPARPASGDDACGDVSRIPLAPPGAQMTVRAAFCTENERITDAAAWAPASAPGAPTFRALTDQILMTVFPERNRLRDGGDGAFGD